MRWGRFLDLVLYLPPQAAFWNLKPPEERSPSTDEDLALQNERRKRLDLPPRKGHLTLLTTEDLGL